MFKYYNSEIAYWLFILDKPYTFKERLDANDISDWINLSNEMNRLLNIFHSHGITISESSNIDINYQLSLSPINSDKDYILCNLNKHFFKKDAIGLLFNNSFKSFKVQGVKSELNGFIYNKGLSPIPKNNLLTLNVEIDYFQISYNDICILPNNPFTGKRQYELWKENAPRLAKAVQEFKNTTFLEFISVQNNTDFAFLSKDNIFYAHNKSIGSYPYDDGLDEYHIPFELIDDV